MTKLELFLDKECIITPSMKCKLNELIKAYEPYKRQKGKGPITCNGLMTKLSKFKIKFEKGEAYGIGLRNPPKGWWSVPTREPDKETDMAYKKIDKEKYGEYLASRKWWVKRQAVMRRANGKCERCKKNPASSVHHLNYARIYEELLTDLQAICTACHDYEHARSNYDPLKS